MNERDRSRLFGRPGKLLVEETSPRIAMPRPPPTLLSDLDSLEQLIDADEDEEAKSDPGPLQVFVGARPADAAGRTSGRSGDTSPGIMMTGAMNDLGDAFLRRSSAARESVEVPEPGSGTSARAAAPEPALVRQRAQGLPTAAARARAAGSQADTPDNPFADDVNTNIEVMPIELLDTPRADEPRKWQRASADISLPGGVRIPGTSSSSSAGESTNLGEVALPFGQMVEPPPPAPVAPRGKPPVLVPSSMPPTVALLGRAPPAPVSRRRSIGQLLKSRRVLLAVAVVVLVAAGIGASRWGRANPGVFASLRDRLPTQADPSELVGAQIGAPVAVEPPANMGRVNSGQVAVAPVAGTPAAVEPVAVEPVAVVAPVPVPEPPAPEPPRPAAVVRAPPPVVVPTPPKNVIAERRGAYQEATGFLQVLCNREAAVYVDGKRVGSTADQDPLEIIAGTHVVKVVAGGRSRSMEVRIDAGRSRQVKFELR